MLHDLARRLLPCSHGSAVAHQLQHSRRATRSSVPTRRSGAGRAFVKGGGGWWMGAAEAKSEWWVVDGEMHEIGDHVPHRERFVIPRDNLPNRRRKQMREQFMRRTRLVLKESEHEPWCKKYMELYQELRENWERLYWDEGYSQKIAQDHANYESPEEDEEDFSPYRRRQLVEESKAYGSGGNRQGWEDVRQIRDKFEFDRERRMRDKAFAPMVNSNEPNNNNSSFRTQPLDAEKFFPQ